MVTSPARTALAGLDVVPMRRRHLRQVLAIESRVYPRPWSPSLFATELAQETRTYLVALDAPRGRFRARDVVGYAGLLVAAGEAHVTTLAVDPAHHRRKVGSRLLLGLLRTARDQGASAATLEVRATNQGAQTLYAQFGFAPVGVRPRYYPGTDEDAVIMWAHDLGTAEFGGRLDAIAARLDLPGGSSGTPDLHVPWVRGRVGLDGTPVDLGEQPDEGGA